MPERLVGDRVSIVFVYFRASTRDDERLASRLDELGRRMLARLPAGARFRFGHRTGSGPDARTWLESYELPPGFAHSDLLAVRAQAVLALGIDTLIDGESHTEGFLMRGPAPCA